MTVQEPLIPKHGGYRNLKSFQVAQLVYDVTVRFCDRYVQKRSRTHDQMVQAARSGVQNIAEGSQAAGTSKKTELKLTNVARASLEELRLDYEDFLRQRGLPIWERNDPRRQSLITRRCKTADEVAAWVKEQRGSGQGGPSGQGGLSGRNGEESKALVANKASAKNVAPGKATENNAAPGKPAEESLAASKTTENRGATSTKSTGSTESTPSTYPERAANAALVLIAVASSLLSRQLASLATAFEQEGGFTERLHRVRTRARAVGR